MMLLLLLLPPPPPISPHLQFRYFSPAGDTTASRFPFNSKPSRKPPEVPGGGGLVWDQSAMLLSS